MFKPDVSQIRAAFARRLRQPRIVVAPGVGDPLGARLVELAGFEAVFMSGYAVESTYGMPDVGMLTLTEMSQRAGQICDAVSIPLVADADTGYGGAVNVTRMVREYERAGVAAIQLEDQAMPKKCGSMAGKSLVSPAEMAGKIRAVLDSRRDPNFKVIARTDAVAVEGLDAALDRLALYQEAGADLMMALGPYTESQAKDFACRSPGPVAYLASESFTMPMFPVHELDAMGVRLAIFPLSLTLASMHAMQRALATIKSEGTTVAMAQDAMTTWSECNEILGLAEVKRIEQQFCAA